MVHQSWASTVPVMADMTIVKWQVFTNYLEIPPSWWLGGSLAIYRDVHDGCQLHVGADDLTSVRVFHSRKSITKSDEVHMLGIMKSCVILSMYKLYDLVLMWNETQHRCLGRQTMQTQSRTQNYLPHCVVASYFYVTSNHRPRRDPWAIQFCLDSDGFFVFSSSMLLNDPIFP